MNIVETVLVILLSVGFLTLIILGIVLVSLLLGIMKNVKRMSQRAEEATGSVASILASLGQRVAPAAISGIVATLVRLFKAKKGED